MPLVTPNPADIVGVYESVVEVRVAFLEPRMYRSCIVASLE